MELKVVHINTVEVSKQAAVKALWENVLKVKWDEQARERGEELKTELKGFPPMLPKDSHPNMRG